MPRAPPTTRSEEAPTEAQPKEGCRRARICKEGSPHALPVITTLRSSHTSVCVRACWLWALGKTREIAGERVALEHETH